MNNDVKHNDVRNSLNKEASTHETGNITDDNSNKTTVVITIALLFVLVIFFTGYSIVNGPSFDKFNSYSRNLDLDNTTNLTNIDINDDYNTDIAYSHLGEGNNGTGEINITGRIEPENTPIFNTEESISNKDQITNNNESETNNNQSNVGSTESNSTNSNNNTTNRVRNVKPTNRSTTNTSVVNTRRNSNPEVYNLLSYDTTNTDINISKEKPYSIQIATHNGKVSAQHIRDILILEGFSAYIFETKIDGVNKYRIRVGTFSSKIEALKTYKNLVDKSKIKGINNCVILKRKY